MPAKKKSPIAIIDYGMGNLSSVRKALEHLGAEGIITSSPSRIARSQKIILPGVGAFGDAMSELKKRRLIEPILHHIAKERKLLGICLGLQLLFESSEESPRAKGLAVFSGEVRRFRTRKAKIPQIGWNRVNLTGKHPVLKGVTSKDFFYFVHSYHAASLPADTLAQSEHGGEVFTAIAGRNNIAAAQFHPEKSQAAGLRILKNFINW